MSHQQPARPGDGHPLVGRYLTKLEAALTRAGARPEEVCEIVADLDSHFAEAQRSGGSLRGVLEGLGGVEELAEAYAVALALGVQFDSPAGHPSSKRMAAKRIARWAATTARVSLMAVISLLGLGFCLTGLTALPAALVLPFVPPGLLDPTLRLGAPQLVVLLAALLCLWLGWMLLRLARLSLRALTVKPRRRSVDGREPLAGEAVVATPPLTTVARPTVESWRRST